MGFTVYNGFTNAFRTGIGFATDSREFATRESSREFARVRERSREFAKPTDTRMDSLWIYAIPRIRGLTQIRERIHTGFSVGSDMGPVLTQCSPFTPGEFTVYLWHLIAQR